MRSAHFAQRARGFTLFEMVVVVFIIGVIVSFATLSVGVSTTRVVQEEVQRLQSLLTLASDESVLQTQELALELYRNGYRFLQLVQAEQSWSWEPVAEDAVFRARCLPDGMEIVAEIEGVGAPLDRVDCAQFSAPPEKDADANAEVATIQKSRLDEDKEPPRVFVLSSGEMTPFDLKLALPDNKTYLRLVGDLTGKMTTRTPEDDKKR